MRGKSADFPFLWSENGIHAFLKNVTKLIASIKLNSLVKDSKWIPDR